MTKDAIITAVSGYEPEHMAVWLNSLNQTSFDGQVFVIAYSVSERLVDYLKERDVVVFTFDHDAKKKRYSYSQLKEDRQEYEDNGKRRTDARWFWNRRILGFTDKVHDRRFYHSSILLDKYCRETGEDFRFLAFSDARDVAFQKNPFDWLEKALPADKNIAVSQEAVTHRDPWNRRMMIKTFGNSGQNRVIDDPVVCCGFFAGRFRAMLDIMLANYYVDQTKRIGDQVALNQLLSFDVWREKTAFTNWTTPWTVHLSTLAQEKQGLGFYASEESLPRMLDDQILTHDGEPFAVVHHHDRFQPYHTHLHETFGTP